MKLQIKTYSAADALRAASARCGNRPGRSRKLKTQFLISAAMVSLSLIPSFVSAAPQRPAITSSGVYVTILSPNPGTIFDGTKQVEVSAFYQASTNTGGVATLDLYIDGHQAATKTLDSPEARGVVSFLIDPTALTAGQHQIVVRASASDAEVFSARTGLSVQAISDDKSGTNSAPAESTPPDVFITAPGPDMTVDGLVHIKVNAYDASGKSPYVSLFVDHQFKTLRNFPPYDFDWDTTRVANGFHTIEVWGYNDAQLVGHASPLKVLVNNPGGRTFIRKDLSDTPGAPQSKASGSSMSSKQATSILALPSLSRHSTQAMSPRTAPAEHASVVPSHQAPALASSSSRQLTLWPNEQLASATTGESTAISDSTLLMAPFVKPVTQSQISSQTPSASVHAGNTDRKSTSQGPLVPTLDTAIASGAVPQRMASAIISEGSTDDEVAANEGGLLSSPTLEPQLHALATPHHVAEAIAGSWTPSPVHLTIDQMLQARGSFQVVMNDKPLQLDRPLQVHRSILFAPFRGIFENQGGILGWDAQTKQVHAMSEDRLISMTIGSRQVLVNNQSFRLDAAPYILSGRTMVPLAFLPLALPVTVSFDAGTGHLIINSKD